jgi:signal peptidase I
MLKKIKKIFFKEKVQETISEKKEESKTKETVLESVKFILTVFVIWLFIRLFIMQPFLVDGASMSPNLETANYLIVDKLSYHFISPKRGDVVVFKFPEDTSKYFIKRIIALPGDTIDIESGKTSITDASGKKYNIEDSFVKFTSPYDTKNLTLKVDEYFVMGDNREHSYDSRTWGPVNKKFIQGKPFVRLFPFTQITLFPASLKALGLTSLEK